MSAYRAVLLVLLVVGGSLAVAAPTSATVDSTEQSDAGATSAAATGDAATDGVAATTGGDAAATDARFAAVQSNDSAAQNDNASTSLGGDISSFMQSSAAEIDGAVETGMWSAEFNATNDRSRQQRLVERRTDDLRTELNDLQERKEELINERDAGNVSEAAYKAQIGQLLGRINALKSAINATEPRARQAGTNVDALEMLEDDAQNLTGPEIAAVARNTTGVGNGSGPPDGVGNANGSNGVGNGDASENVGGSPEDVGNGSGPLEDANNGSQADAAGPPNGVGNGTIGGNGAAHNNGAANGNGTAGSNGAAAGRTTGPNAATSAGGGSDDSFGAFRPTTESLGLEPVSDAINARMSTVLRALPFA